MAGKLLTDAEVFGPAAKGGNRLLTDDEVFGAAPITVAGQFGTAASNIPAALAESVGGNLQAIGEQNPLRDLAQGARRFRNAEGFDKVFAAGEVAAAAPGAVVDALRGIISPDLYMQQRGAQDVVADVGQTTADFWNKQRAPIPMPADPLADPLHAATGFGAQALEGVVPSLATGAAVTLATRNPNLGAASIIPQVQGGEYAQERRDGAAPQEARTLAGMKAAAEVIPEATVLGKMAGDGGPVLLRALRGAPREAWQEAQTQWLQDAIDHPDWTVEQRVKSALYAAGLGAVGGAAVGAVFPGGQQDTPAAPPPAAPAANPAMAEALRAVGGDVAPDAAPEMAPSEGTLAERQAATAARRAARAAERTPVEELQAEDIEAAPAPADRPMTDEEALVDLAARLRQRQDAPAANIDVTEEQAPVTQIEAAPPPPDGPQPPFPPDPPAGGIKAQTLPIEEILAALPPPTWMGDQGIDATETVPEDITAAPAPEPQTEIARALQAMSDAVLEAQQRIGKPAEVEQLPMESIDAAPAPSDLPPQGGLQTDTLPVDEIEAAPPPTREYVPPTAQPAKQQAPAPAAPAREPENLGDRRILNETYRNGLGALANELEKGGGVSYVYNERGDIAGRSSSVNPPWFQTFAAKEKVSVTAAKETVEKALAGKRLGDKQARLIRHMLDTVEDREGMLGEEFLNRTSAEAEAEARRSDMALEDDFYPPEFDAEERAITELAAAARDVDAEAADAILDSQASDADVARQLQEIIDRGRESETSAGAPARDGREGNQAQAQEPAGPGEANVPPGADAQDGAVTAPAPARYGSWGQAVEPTDETAAILRRHGLPADTDIIAGQKQLTRGKFMVEPGNWRDTMDEAAADAARNIASEQRNAERDKQRAAKARALADTIRLGDSPTDQQWADGLSVPVAWVKRGWVYQFDVSPWLVEHFADRGFRTNRIAPLLGKAAGKVRSDSGAENAIVYLKRLPDVLQAGGQDGPVVREETDAYAAEPEGRRLKRTLDNMTPAESKAFKAFIKAHPHGKRIMADLKRLAGTPWAKQAIEGVLTRQAIRMTMDGRTPDFESALDSGQVRSAREALRRGEEGLFGYLQSNFLGEAEKPVNNVNSSFINCSPSKDCATHCYATRGNYIYAGSITKAELITEAVERDPVRVAKSIADEYKATLEFAQNKALRIFDKGDGSEAWAKVVNELNRRGVRVQVFSKVPEFLRAIPESNVRLLSIDGSNAEMADQHKDLPVAFVYTGKAQIPLIRKLLDRQQLQVVLPIKQGAKVLGESEVVELKRAAPGVGPYLCPIDAGYKMIPSKAQKQGRPESAWTCTKCDKNGALGCFFGQPTEAVLAAARSDKQKAKDVEGDADLRALKELLDELGIATEDGGPLARIGRDPAGRLAGLIPGARRVVDRLLAGTDGGAEGRGNRGVAAAGRNEGDRDLRSVPSPRKVEEGDGGTGYTVEAKRGNYGVDPRQYELFPAAQKRAHDAARSAVERLAAGWGKATVLGNRLAAGFKERGHAKLLGQRVESPEDLAVLAQVYRDPRFETFRIFAADANGRIVHQTGTTSRLPGAAMTARTNAKGEQDAIAEWDEIMDEASAAGAKSIYILHNHPSGISTASGADQRMTAYFGGFLTLKHPDLKFGGHVIINHKEYSLLDETGDVKEHRAPLNVKVDYDVKVPSVPFPMLGAIVGGPSDLAALSKMVEADDNQVVIIGRSTSNVGVSLVATIPLGSLTSMRAAVALRNMAINSGSLELFAVVKRKDKALPYAAAQRAKWAIKRNLLVDVVIADENGKFVRSLYNDAGPAFARFELGRRQTAFRVEDVRDPYGDVESYRARYKRVAERVVDGLDAVLSPLGSVRVDRDEMGRFKGVSLSELPGRQDYLKRRYEALGMVAKADEAARSISRGFQAADADTKQQVFEFLTNAEASPASIGNVEARRFAVAAKRKIGEISDQLVAAGLLSEESREAHRDAYLPRMYLRYLLTEADYRLLGAGKRPSSMGYLRQRKDIPEDVRRVILGEVKDPGFLSAAAIARPARDLALLDWLGDISQDSRWVAPNSIVDFRGQRVTPRWLKAEAQQLRAQARHYESAEDAQAARELANRMDDAADAALEAVPGDILKDYRAIPDTPQYGRLRGLMVRAEIYEDIVGIRDMMPTQPGWAEKLLGYGGIGTTLTQLFKMSKVALNPPGQVRNAVSNAVLLQLSGVPLHKVPSYVHRAWRDVVTDGRYWNIGKKYGVTESTFTSQELFRFKRELLELQKNEGKLDTWGKLHLAFAKVADTAGDVYQFMEALFKTAKIMHAMDEQGMDEADAALEAQRWMFDYSFVGRNTKYLRNAPVGMPFVTFQLKVLPRLVEVLALHPQRLIPWVGLFYGLQYGIAAALDVDDDDIETLKKALPEWLQERGHVVMVPYKDDAGRWQFVDLGYFMPWSMYTEAGGQIGRGDLGKAVQTVGAFGGPLPDIITAIKTGIDPFTDRPIVEAGDPPQRQLMSILNYVWSMAAPPFITENGWLGKMRDAAQGALDANGDPAATNTQAMLRLAGLNTYAVEPAKSRAQNLRRMQYELRDVASRLRYEMKRTKDPERRKALREEYGTEIKRRADELKQYARDSQIPPKLR